MMEEEQIGDAEEQSLDVPSNGGWDVSFLCATWQLLVKQSQ